MSMFDPRTPAGKFARKQLEDHSSKPKTFERIYTTYKDLILLVLRGLGILLMAVITYFWLRPK